MQLYHLQLRQWAPSPNATFRGSIFSESERRLGSSTYLFALFYHIWHILYDCLERHVLELSYDSENSMAYSTTNIAEPNFSFDHRRKGVPWVCFMKQIRNSSNIQDFNALTCGQHIPTCRITPPDHCFIKALDLCISRESYNWRLGYRPPLFPYVPASRLFRSWKVWEAISLTVWRSENIGTPKHLSYAVFGDPLVLSEYVSYNNEAGLKQS